MGSGFPYLGAEIGFVNQSARTALFFESAPRYGNPLPIGYVIVAFRIRWLLVLGGQGMTKPSYPKGYYHVTDGEWVSAPRYGNPLPIGYVIVAFRIRWLCHTLPPENQEPQSRH